MQITRRFKDAPLNWGALPELPACLNRHGVCFLKASVEIGRFPDDIEYDSLEEAHKDILKNGPPDFYRIEILAKQGKQDIQLRLGTFGHYPILSLVILGLNDSQLPGAIGTFLGLKPAEPVAPASKPKRTAFIAHQFDSVGTSTADKVARFLGLLGFQVVTGRGYAPGPVSDKVRARLEQQALVFVLLTPGDDATWLTQESLFANVNNKPLFLLKERTASFKSALLADHEYIPFDGSNVETTFIPILEGLRELGYR
jgi:hypothetical protein